MTKKARINRKKLIAAVAVLLVACATVVMLFALMGNQNKTQLEKAKDDTQTVVKLAASADEKAYGGDPAAAVKMYDEAIEKSKASGGETRKAAVAAGGQQEQSENTETAEIEISETRLIRQMKVAMLINVGRYDAAIAEAKIMEAEKSDSAVAHDIALAAERKGDNKMALEYYKKRLQLLKEEKGAMEAGDVRITEEKIKQLEGGA